MYSPFTPELAQLRIEDHLREAERFRQVSQALRKRKAIRRAQAIGGTALVPLRRALALTTAVLFRAGH